MGHLQARDVVAGFGKRLAEQDPHESRNSSGQIDNDEFVQWEVVQTTMNKFDEETEKAFDNFRTLPGEDGTDRDQVCTAWFEWLLSQLVRSGKRY